MISQVVQIVPLCTYAYPSTPECIYHVEVSSMPSHKIIIICVSGKHFMDFFDGVMCLHFCNKIDSLFLACALFSVKTAPSYYHPSMPILICFLTLTNITFTSLGSKGVQQNNLMPHFLMHCQNTYEVVFFIVET